jgi:ABC-type transporter Mla subunit MlaD
VSTEVPIVRSAAEKAALEAETEPLPDEAKEEPRDESKREREEELTKEQKELVEIVQDFKLIQAAQEKTKIEQLTARVSKALQTEFTRKKASLAKLANAVGADNDVKQQISDLVIETASDFLQDIETKLSDQMEAQQARVRGFSRRRV